jgi:superfamily II DNA or RNA helicase
MDPYIWEQGQELFRRGAVEDFQMAADGTIQVRVLDPRDARKFFVTVEKDRDGAIRARCQCPYRLGGFCRHQVVSLEYLRTIAQGEAAAAGENVSREKSLPKAGSPAGGEAAAPSAQADGAKSTAQAPVEKKEPVLYRVFGKGAGVATEPDGSLLRVVLHSLGSLKVPHRLGLQVFTGTGWTELRTGDVGRWIVRGSLGPHARDALLESYLSADGALRREVDSERFASILSAVSGSNALVDRGGRKLAVSPWAWRLEGRLGRGDQGGLAVELCCRSRDGESRPFPEVSLVPSVAPWIQLEDGTFYPLAAGAPGPDLLEIQEAELTAFADSDLDRFLTQGVPHLERLCLGAVETEPGLIEEVEGVVGARLRLEGTLDRLSGRLEFSYGGEWVFAPETPEPWTVTREGKIHRYPPAGQSLARAQRELEGLAFRRSEGQWAAAGPGLLARLLAPRPRTFVKLELPGKLEALNFAERAPTLRFQVSWGEGGEEPLPADGQAEAPFSGNAGGGAGVAPFTPGSRRAKSGISWLEVTCGLMDGEREVAVDLHALRKAFQENPEGLTQLGDGTVLSLKHASVRSLLEVSSPVAIAASVQGKTRVRLPLAYIGEFMEEEPGRVVELDPKIRAFVDGLRQDAALEPPALEPAVADVLRPYQKEAVRWLGLLARWGLGGILADEMGLGKTIMALAHFFGRVGGEARGEPQGSGREGPVLVVCPSSLVFNWLDECRRFFPDVEAQGLHGQPPAAREEIIKKGPALLVTSYALLRRDREALEARDFGAILLDEAQHIKNAESQTAQAAFALRARERWILTGTPIENHLGELWSLFQFLLPGFLGKSSEFRQKYEEPIARQEEDVLSRLRAKIRPFLLRRTKAQVLTELPPRIDQIERVPMTSAQRTLYEAQLLRARSQLEGADPATSRFQLLAALTRLRQICCHPRLVLGDEKPDGAKDAAEMNGGKFELLRELLEECLEEGHRVLLYSQFTSMLDLIEGLLKDLDAPRCRLDGSTRDREGEVRRFARDSSVPVFLISLKAGGLGLNLTQADTVILYDPWWNPAAEEQAAARAHRMGQTVPVHVHKLITAETVEEKILDLQASKRDLAGRVVRSEEEAIQALTADDLRQLLF